MKRMHTTIAILLVLCAVVPRKAVAQLAYEQPKATSCLPEGSWVWAPITDSSIYTHDPCIAVDRNWSDTGIPDLVLNYGAVTVRLVAAQAGALASVRVNDVEFIESPAHGSSFTFLSHTTPPWWTIARVLQPDGRRIRCG